MDKKIFVGVAALVIAGGAFYGGTWYAKSSAPTRQSIGGQFQNQGRNRTNMSGFTVGEIIGKDATSITVKMQDGSTKIVLISTSTPVMKATTGSLADLSAGVSVLVTGSTNSDGSITAQTLQIRPAGQLGFGNRGNPDARGPAVH